MAESALASEPLLRGPRSRMIAGAWATGVGAAAALLVGQPVPQSLAYHAFADARTLLGIPNALDVLSNAAFAVVGAAGLALVIARGRALDEAGGRGPWLALFVGVLAVAVGSAYYHLGPCNERLFWDRLPMSVAFAAMLAALVGDRAGAPAGARLLGPVTVMSAASVVYWILTERAGAGDLRPYLLVQLGSMAAVPVALVGSRRSAGTGAWWVAAALYAAAKIAEAADGAVLRATGLFSGHTLKHVLAAIAIGALVVSLARRTIPPPRSR